MVGWLFAFQLRNLVFFWIFLSHLLSYCIDLHLLFKEQADISFFGNSHKCGNFLQSDPSERRKGHSNDLLAIVPVDDHLLPYYQNQQVVFYILKYLLLLSTATRWMSCSNRKENRNSVSTKLLIVIAAMLIRSNWFSLPIKMCSDDRRSTNFNFFEGNSISLIYSSAWGFSLSGKGFDTIEALLVRSEGASDLEIRLVIQFRMPEPWEDCRSN